MHEKTEGKDKLNRRFSKEFKRKKVAEIRSNKVSIAALSREYNVSRSAIHKWVYLYSDKKKGTKVVLQMDSEEQKTAYYRNRVAELERLYGQKQLEVEYLNKGYEVLSKELGFDVKKKYATALLNTIDK